MKVENRMTDPTDCQLLERFVTYQDEAAFSILARRHAARVLGVCRHVLCDEHDAEDTFQATFLVLTRKAVTLPALPSIGPWLSAVAYRLALHTRAARRRRRERPSGLLLDNDEDGRQLVIAEADPITDVARQELCGIVREELAGLPEKYRAPVVLCYLEGKTNEEAARELGWPNGSMSRRLEKARQLLRERLTGRGLAVLSVLLCLGLALVWFARTGSWKGGNPVQVAAAMSRFEPVAEGQSGTEGLLRRLAEERQPAIDRQQVVALAATAAEVAERIDDHNPGRLRADWKRFAQEMNLAARQLADAATADDRPATRLAAARLHTTCLRCHEIFRD